MAVQGQTFFQASGDWDGGSAITWSPYLTLVGGTTLTTAADGSYQSETVWNDGNGIGSSGGFDSDYIIPEWQAAAVTFANQGSTIYRNVPDVALIAANVFICADNGGVGSAGGTSCAAPLWAGFIALVNQQAASSAQPSVGFLNPTMYALGASSKYASTFHDITSGNNFSPTSPDLYSAGAGYDLCTGWGSPNGMSLINYLAAPVAPAITAQPRSLTVTAGQTATFTVTASGTAPLAYQWSLNGAAISGANSASYTTPATTTAGSGAAFTVTVSNAAGSLTSSAATLTVNPAPICSGISPASGPPGTLVTLTGQYFTGVTAVSFGGIPAASFTILGSTTITATVANDSLTGLILITTATGVTCASPGTFTVQHTIVTIDLAPDNLLEGATFAFSATVTGTPDQRVTWSVQEPEGGAIDASGNYIAPTNTGTYHVLATSAADAAAVAIAAVPVHSACLAPDSNGSLTVIDMAYFMTSMGSKVGDAHYNVLADLNGDGSIDDQDLSLFLGAF